MKKIILEGRYDSITREVVRDVISIIKKNSYGYFSLPWDLKSENAYVREGMEFTVDLNIEQTDVIDYFEINSGVVFEEDENIILINIFLGDMFTERNVEEMFYKLQEDVRHEIEHFTQFGFYRIEDRPKYKGSTSKLKTVYGHHKNILEVPALVHGFYRRSKIEKRPIDDVMLEDLIKEVEKGVLSKTQARNLFKIWMDFSKKNLPRAKYTNLY
jgi:hypothetical protein